MGINIHPIFNEWVVKAKNANCEGCISLTDWGLQTHIIDSQLTQYPEGIVGICMGR